jgi:zinc protease
LRTVTSTAILFGLLIPLSIPGQDIKIDIPHEKFVLSNGLTVIVHEDRKAPIVAVNVWYHVGSKNEKRGKTGFAHLFEHLMFNGSEHFDQDYFKVLEKLGATDLNGTTDNDRTNYFQNVPTSSLDTVLWMESDRMGHLLKAVTQAKLDEQRGVVQNEKRQGENQPYGLVYNMITENTHPSEHPYSWTVIGSMEDLNAASLEDVHEWFKTYYGPNNATIVLAGDIDVKTAKQKVEKYFGAIPPGPPIPKHRVWVAKRQESHRTTLQDRVPQARIYRVWNVPQAVTEQSEHLSLAAAVLGQGKTSRLYKRLVYDEQLATDVNVFSYGREIEGMFQVMATARPGVELERVEKALDEELEKFLSTGPTAEELQLVKTRSMAAFLRGVERIGGFGGKSDVLARGQVYAGDPSAYKKQLTWRQGATPEQVHQAAKQWLSDGAFTLEVEPYPQLKTLTSEVDRSKVPEPGAAPELRLPKLQRASLSNGLKIILAERHELPLLSFNLVVDGGFAADQGGLPGTAKLAMAMLDEGTKTRNALQISEALEGLGASLNTSADIDQVFVSLSALKTNLDKSLEVFADVVRNPSFPETDFKREQKQLLAAIQREKVQPFTMGLRVVPRLIYGNDHPYGMPLTGSGTEQSVTSISREMLTKFHQTWFKPNNATLVVVGDTTLPEIQPKLEKLFGGWEQGTVPKKEIQTVEHQDKPVVYVMDRPGAIQSIIFAGHLGPPKSDPDEIALDTLNTILGGAFISRVNMNLREDKHWSYGAGTALLETRAQRPFMSFAPVQSDKTSESMAEIRKELLEITRDRPATAEELAMAQDNQTLSLPGSRETSGQIAHSIVQLLQFGLPDDYWDTYVGKVRKLTLQDMKTAAEKLVHPDKLVWVVVGDRSKIESGIKELNFGEVKLIDADGNPIQ